MNEQLLKRVKSLAWRAGVVGLVAAVAEVSGGVGDLGLPEVAVILVGLVASEITKFLNSKK